MSVARTCRRVRIKLSHDPRYQKQANARREAARVAKRNRTIKGGKK